MKFCEIGVYHHDCWFTDAITRFPEMSIRETSSRVCNSDSGIKVNKASYRISSQDEMMLHDFLSRISQGGRILEAKTLSITGNSAIIEVSWKAARPHTIQFLEADVLLLLHAMPRMDTKHIRCSRKSQRT